MWRKSENGENVRPPEMEESGTYVIVRKNFALIDATEDIQEHWEYDEWQMTKEQYEVYQYYEEIVSEQADALVELAEIIAEGM